MKTTLCVLAVAVLFAGCGGSHPQPEVEPAYEPVINIPERLPYRIALGDRLEIRFPYYREYDVSVVVRPDGAITVPEVGEILVEGMTPLELESIVRGRFAQIVAEPEVTVMVTDPSGLRVFIFGEVRLPGAQTMTGSMTLLDAIATAGGVTDRAKQNNVILMRPSADGTYVGSKYDLGKILDGGATNPYLSGRDVIYIPMTAIGKVDVFVNQFFTQLTPPWLFIIRGREALDPDGTYLYTD